MKLRHTQLSIPANGVWLDGMLAHAPDVRALALCLHSHGHPALEQAARPLELALQAAGFATMVVNLLTRQEAQLPILHQFQQELMHPHAVPLHWIMLNGSTAFLVHAFHALA